MRAFVAMLLLAGAGAGAAAPLIETSTTPPAGTPLATIDPDSRFEFALFTRWGQEFTGRFPQVQGDIVALPDGRRQVRITLPTADVEIIDHPRYTRFARGPRFFDVARFPDVQFVSEPYTLQLLTDGGVLAGRLRMHGVQRRERFTFEPGTCDRPGRGCDIVARGTVQRANYDIDGWSMALRDEVRFTMRVRLRDVAASGGQ